MKEQIEKILESLTKDAGLIEKFKKEPVNTVKDLLDDVLTDEMIEKIVEAVKAKLTAEQISDAVGVFGKLFKS